jgi:hypothetical protein
VPLLLVGAAAPVLAHAMRVSVTVSAADVRVKVTYDADEEHGGGGATVKLLDVQNEAVGEGKPDKDGVCVFPRPKPGVYRVVAQDDFGHRAERVVAVQEGTEETVSAPPEQSRGLMVAVGLGVIAVVTLAWYWLAGRKKG